MGIVSVRPGKLPAKVIVAPNSPRARAQHKTAPAPSDGAISGTVTRRNTVIRAAPRVAAASSKPWVADRSAPSTVISRKGRATKVSAITTATGVNGIVSPNQESRYLPTNPVRPKASSNAIPPTTGGITSGRVPSARTSRCPGKLLRASNHASGTPITREIAVAAVAVHSDSWRAWVASDPLRADPSLRHGARITSPARGSSRKATATSAGASNGAGTDLGEPPRAARRARSGAVRRDGVARRVTAAAADLRAGLLEPGGAEGALACGGQDIGEESLRDGRAAAVSDHGDRVGRRGVDTRRDLHAHDLALGGQYIGHVDHPRVDTAELDLGQHRFHVRFQRDRLDGDLGVLEYLRRGHPARHLRLAQRDLDRRLRQVVNGRDLCRVGRRHGDLHNVLGEVRRTGRVTGGDDLLHVLCARRGEHVGRRAADNLRGQSGAWPEAERHLVPRMERVELLAELSKRFLQRRGGEHGNRSRCRRRRRMTRAGRRG